MTPKETYNHLLLVLVDTKNHTIVKHILPSGSLCYRVRDAKVNPIANMPESIFEKLKENKLIIKKTEREWQLNQQQYSLLNEKQSTTEK